MKLLTWLEMFSCPPVIMENEGFDTLSLRFRSLHQFPKTLWMGFHTPSHTYYLCSASRVYKQVPWVLEGTWSTFNHNKNVENRENSKVNQLELAFPQMDWNLPTQKLFFWPVFTFSSLIFFQSSAKILTKKSVDHQWSYTLPETNSSPLKMMAPWNLGDEPIENQHLQG